MEVHEASETVIVTGSQKNFEFRIEENGLEPVSSDVPSEVFDIVEQRTSYDVRRPDEPREFDSLTFKGPYEGNEAASVLDFEIDDDRFSGLVGLMRYGIRISIKVYPDGETEVYKVNGEELADPIEV